MKTKNFLLTGALLIVALFSVNGVKGQTTPAKTGTTNVNIKLNPIQAILVNDAEVNLNYTTLDDYNQGVDTLMQNHLTVYSVGGFIVNVKSDGDFKGTNGSIDAADVKITATPAEGSPGDFAEVTLSNTENSLISSTTGGFEKNYDVNYSTKEAGNAFKYAAKEGGDYTAIVTYEIIAAN